MPPKSFPFARDSGGGEAGALEHLSRASKAGHKGETLLRVLALIDEKGLVHTNPALLFWSLKALQRAGFESVARQVAAEIVLTHNLL